MAHPEIGVLAFERWLDRFGALVSRDVDILTEMDAAIGDADHGVNMQRGMKAVAARIKRPPGSEATCETVCVDVGTTLVSAAGGAGGLLYGCFFTRLGAAAGSATALTPEQFAAVLRAGLAGVVERGAARVGDKTMVDAMAPAVAAFAEAATTAGWSGAAEAAVRAASEGFRQAIPLIARRGRASYLGSRSAGHPDPGSASTVLLFEALRDVLAQ